jgi:hypothetical protein
MIDLEGGQLESNATCVLGAGDRDVLPLQYW